MGCMTHGLAPIAAALDEERLDLDLAQPAAVRACDDPELLGRSQPLRLTAVENRLDDVRREAGEQQQAADEGDPLVLGERLVIDLARPLSICRRQRCARTTALISFRSPRHCPFHPILR